MPHHPCDSAGANDAVDAPRMERFMKTATSETPNWFDLCGSVRRESRRRALQALLVRPAFSLRRLALVVLLCVFSSVVLKASFVEAFFVRSDSMTPTLQRHDYIVVPKFLFGLQLPLVNDVVVTWSKPHRGDVIVFHRPLDPSSNEEGFREAVVKRVIALEGDLVEIRGNQVFLNGHALVEPYARWAGDVADWAGDAHYHFGPARVPAGSVFVLGDNRDRSEDSRSWSDPFVSLSQVVGKAVMVYWSAASENRVGTVL